MQEPMRPVHRQLDPEHRPDRLHCERPLRDDDVESRKRPSDDEPDDRGYHRRGGCESRGQEQVHDIGTQPGTAHRLIVAPEYPLEGRQQGETEEHASRGLVADAGRDDQRDRKGAHAEDAPRP